MTLLSYIITPFSGGPIDWNGVFWDAFLVVVYPIILFTSILRLRTDHPYVVYTLWYLFSLTFIISIAVNYLGALPIVAPGMEIDIIPQSTISFISHALFVITDLDSDSYFLGGLMGLIIVPQIIAYILAGMFGCAARPIFIITTVK